MEQKYGNFKVNNYRIKKHLEELHSFYNNFQI